MECPACNKTIGGPGKQTIYDTRACAAGVRRRRKCNHCAHRFSTIEQLADKAEKEALTITREHISAILAKLDEHKCS